MRNFIIGYNRNASNSPLLRLSPELRNRIYGYVFAGAAFPDRFCAEPGALRKRIVDSELKEPAPTQIPELMPACNVRFPTTCRQTYPEARLLPSTLNTLQHCCGQCARNWVTTMGGQINAVNTVRFSARNISGYIKSAD